MSITYSNVVLLVIMNLFSKSFFKYGIFLMAVLLPFFVVGLVFLGHSVAYGQTFNISSLPSVFGVFGGRILTVIYCTCSPGQHVIVVGPPRPGRILITPATRIYAFGMVSKLGSYVMGTHTAPGVCLIPA